MLCWATHPPPLPPLSFAVPFVLCPSRVTVGDSLSWLTLPPYPAPPHPAISVLDKQTNRAPPVHARINLAASRNPPPAKRARRNKEGEGVSHPPSKDSDFFSFYTADEVLTLSPEKHKDRGSARTHALTHSFTHLLATQPPPPPMMF